MKRAVAGLLAGLGIVGLVTSVQAETLPIAGIYAAGEDAPSEVQLIALGNFGGRAGERLALAIDSSLRRATINGQPYFDITFDSGGGDRFYIYDSSGNTPPQVIGGNGGSEATMRGYASSEVRESDAGTEDVKECVRRDDKDKCIEERTVKYECRNVIVSMRPDIRLATGDGRLLYSKTDNLTSTQRYCRDERDRPSVDTMLQGLVDQFANTVRYDLAPSYRSEGQRVLESRKGVAKEDRDAFKRAVKLTKNDPLGACLAFEALEANNPEDISVLFNIGLCRESEGDLDEAARLYRQVLALEPGKNYAEDGLRRIASRRRANRQLDIHYGPEGE